MTLLVEILPWNSCGENKDLFNLHSQYNRYWWSGDAGAKYQS